ncbi:MAG: sulfite exporter TauE/SafE family protein [Treponema sp.]|jgi:sulfite exporter TauE/SafE/copper chaperone CopZ/plastocyanin domain-containing protein|nr:sulfite exporter TauE/SafE family protein [Treponema sp.]
MEAGIKTRKLHIDGMTCVNCQNKIEKKLLNTEGIEEAEVSYTTGTAVVTYNTDTITMQEITSIIERLDYQVHTDYRSKPDTNHRNIGILVIIVALFMLIQQFGLINLFNAFPLAEAGMGYGMLLIIGLMTSVHCVAMCGGINLSQCIPQASPSLQPSLLYNLGRVVSYTAVGIMVGALGSVISFSGRMQGGVQLAAGVCMVIMGINMLGIFPWLRRFNLRIPKVFTRRIEAEQGRSNRPLYVGILNGLMPCGPLQAMQLYALSTGSPLKGGISMLIFSLGTVPLMFGLGALSSVLSKQFTKTVMTIGAVLVVVLGLSMFSNGWSLADISNPLGFSPLLFAGVSGGKNGVAAGKNSVGPGAATGVTIENGIQVVNSTLAGGRYPPITVQAGIPVQWTINAPAGSINGCNNRMIIPEYGIEHKFTLGANVIEFTPTKTGRFRYSCWMGMIRSTITVVEPGADSAAVSAGTNDKEEDWGNVPSEPVPAGFRIPTKDMAIATIDGERIQRVQINLTDKGFNPAVVIVQAGVGTAWTINNGSLREENSLLLFPAYGQEIPVRTGANTLSFSPETDFDFSTSDSEYYGYVKVVDDVQNLDLDAIKGEISAYQTMIYPPDYFQGAGGGSCCAR